jgi:hypothetical protein
MNIPKNVTGLFINKGLSFTVVSWNKVIKDIDNNYTITTAYNIYKGSSNDITKMNLIAIITNLDETGTVKSVYFDFANDNNFYAIQSVNSFGVSDIVSNNSIGGAITMPIIINSGLIWNEGNWNQKNWN